MTEVVIAVFEAASAAETAVADLEGARVPTTTIRQFVSDLAADGELREVRSWRPSAGERVVAVTVSERHKAAVLEILNVRTPTILTEAPLFNAA
jgi:hypothetical protein